MTAPSCASHRVTEGSRAGNRWGANRRRRGEPRSAGPVREAAQFGARYRAVMPLGVTRPLRAALRAASTPAELLVLLGQPALATQLPPALTVRQLMDAAWHLAALRRHPYISPDHVALAAARAAGDAPIADGLAARLAARLAGVPVPARRWWRPLGRQSAFRPRGQRLLDDHQRAAYEREERPTGER
jgi:hypothetical protein